ncbi:hypothetical protein [Stenotrophomonas sp. NLF4-10]|uniref:hypothetical protein n=1 Tax=Stenotrophomonas sp. NLF4-10 TaxID=2918754 RepID=UPI001EFAFC96|nr:hypothetical protein [Stenotrophomonas sp. NLF4-10]MCG8275374.1 hypothetical protein [Stenotrophomonas sp. NLF4-10]
MQRMISHHDPLTPCSKGHTARHIQDLRRSSAGGGHSIECACSHTARHEDFERALAEWEQMHRPAGPKRARTAPRRVFPTMPQLHLAL